MGAILLAFVAASAVVAGACDNWVTAHITNDSSVDVIVYVNGDKTRQPPYVVRKGTSDGVGPPASIALESVEVVSLDATGAPADQLTARIDFPGGTRTYTRLRLTGPPLVIEKVAAPAGKWQTRDFRTTPPND